VLNSRWLRQRGQAAWMMGVLNCTPDSFSDGQCVDVEALVEKAKLMVKQGAHMIDIGGESTRPNAQPVGVEEELKRVIPVIQTLSAQTDIPISIDTMKAAVMAQAIDAGVTLVNDVSALTFDAQSMDVVASSGVNVCLMHMQGLPATMQKKPSYHDVLAEVLSFFEHRIESCLAAGIQASSIILDPGIGFGKGLEENLKLISNIGVIKKQFGLPVLLGASRKSFLGLMTDSDVHSREIETAVASAIGVFCGADMIRVHDCDIQSKAAVVASYLADHKSADHKQGLTC